jgi:hydroxymethylbilane synthase
MSAELPLRVGTRGSPLALVQTRLFLHLLTTFCPVLRGMSVFEEHAIRTTGDRVQDRRLAEIGGKGLFAKEIHEALADGRVDFAVHSLKDLETELPAGIVLACTLKREDSRDALILGPDVARCPTRPRHSTVCRPARCRHVVRAASGAVAARSPGPDHHPHPRQRADAAGQTRFRRMRGVAAGAGRFEAAWVWRTKPRSCWTRMRWCPPAGQGIIGITVRESDTELREMLAAIEDPEAKAVSTAERAMLAELDGSCRTPIGGHARLLPNGELASDRPGGAGGRVVPAEAVGAWGGGRRGADRHRTWRPACARTARAISLADLARPGASPRLRTATKAPPNPSGAIRLSGPQTRASAPGKSA